MKRWLVYSLLSIFFLFLLILGGMSWIVTTENGLHFLVEQAQRWAPGEIKIETVEGQLLDQINLTGLSYHHDDTKVQVDSFKLSWEPSALWNGQVHVKQLHISGIETHLPKSEKKESAPLKIPDIQLPVSIALDDVQINQVVIKRAEAEPIIIDSIELVSNTTDVLLLQHLQVKSPLVNAKLAGEVGFTAPHTVQLNLDWSAKLPEFTVVGTGQLSGDTQQLSLTHTVSKPLEVDLTATATDLLGALVMDAQLTWQEIYWPFNPAVAEDYLVNSQQGQVTLTGALENYQFDFKAKISGKHIPPGHWTIAAQGNQQELILKKLHTELLTGTVDATGKVRWQPNLAGQLNFNADQITLKPFWKDWPEPLRLNSQLVAQLEDDHLNINQLEFTIPSTAAKVSFQGDSLLTKQELKTGTLTWEQVRWPLASEQQTIVNSPTGQLKLSGTLSDYQLELDTQIAGATLPTGHWNLKGQGNQQQFQLESLQAQTLQGVIKAIGEVSWKPTLAAQIDLNAEQLTIKDFWPQWPDNFRLNSQLVAKLDDKNFEINQLNLKIPQTSAQLSLQGAGTRIDNNWHLQTATLNWQDLHWPLTAPAKTGFLVTSDQGQMKVAGTLQNYQVNLTSQLAGAKMPSSQLIIAGQGNLQQFTVDSLRAKTLEGTLGATGKVNWKPTLAAQLHFNADQITLKDFWPDWPANFRLESQLIAEFEKDQFKIQELQLKIPQTTAQLSLQGEGTLTDNNPQLKTATLAWQGLHWPLSINKDQKDFLVTSPTGQVNLTGSLQNYQVKLATELAGTKIPPSQWTINGQGTQQQFTVNSVDSKILTGALKGTGQVSWQPSLAAQLHLNAEKITLTDLWPDWPEPLRLNSELIAQLDGDEFKIKQLKAAIPQTATQLSLQADGTLAGDQTRFDTKLAWQGMQWPLTGPEVIVNSSQGNLEAQGTLQAYELNLTTDIKGKNIPTGQWQAKGKGDSKHLELTTLQGDILQGALDLTGQIGWQPQVNWQLMLKGQNLNPGHQWPEWPGKLALDLNTQGHLDNGGLETQLKVKQIQGQLRDYPLQFQTQIAVNQNNYQITQLELESGNNHLTAHGKLGPTSKLDWAITAPDLATLLPDGQGHLIGKGSLTGPLNLPHLAANLEGHKLAFQKMSLAELQVDVDVNLLSDQDLRLEVVATDFEQGTTQIERLSLQGQGQVNSHTLVASVTMPKDRFSLQLKGGFESPRWQGQLQQLTAATAAIGYWQLQAPAALTLSATEVQLTQSCLQNTQAAQLCTQLQWQKTGHSTVQAALKKLPLQAFNALLSPGSELTGIINGTITANLQPEGALNSNVAINLSPGVFQAHWLEEAQQLTHQGGALKLQVNQNGLVADLKLSLLDNSGLQGSLKLPRFTHFPPHDEQPMQGQLKATFADLSILPTFVPQADNTQGQVKMDFHVDGTLAKPQLQGQLEVTEVAAELPDLGLRIKNLNLTARSEHNTIQMQAHLNSGEGELNLKGQAQLKSFTDWNADLTMTGDNFEVANIPMAWVLISPDIKIKMLPEHIHATGQVLIPQAAITPPKALGSGAVTASSDVVIINPETPVTKPEKNPSNLAISSEVKVILGENVTFDGYGFKSRFGGALVASNRVGKTPTGNGELQIIDGNYKAYGQNLKVDRGRVFFTGGPIDNPGLDIQAYRRIERGGDDDVIAGVHIQGSAQSPRIVLFSNPTLDQSNTLSYIILGKPAAKASEGEGQLLLNAAAALPLEGGNSLTKTIGQQFGLDEATISSEGGFEEAALVLGKYLTPGLYISYGIGLFDGSKVLQMRYELTKRLTLETETGSQSGVDLRYTLER